MSTLEETFFRDNVPNCSGCEACLNRCPVGAISMIPNDEGFRFPSVDADRCIGCRLCVQICPVLNESNPALHCGSLSPDVYAARSNDPNVVKVSSSGGVFSVAAEAILARGGCVYGAVMSAPPHVTHSRAETVDQLRLMRGSKYVQSQIGTTYRDVERDLSAGRCVLFSGTPCQVAGLMCYLGRSHPQLVTCEVLCHGVPSDLYIQRYVEWLCKRRRATLTDMNFRDKRKGWRKYGVSHRFSDGSELYQQQVSSLYMAGYLCNICLRQGCAACGVSRLPRVSDLSLGDFWGIHKLQPTWDVNMGMSLVLVNTEKGERFYKTILNRLTSTPMSLKDVCAGNPTVVGPLRVHPKRSAFLRDLQIHSYRYIRLKYACFIFPPFNRWYKHVKKWGGRLRRLLVRNFR